MQILSTNSQPTRRALSGTPSGDKPPSPEGPKDSFAGAIGKESVRSAVGLANAFGTVTGGAVGVASMIPALYAGVLGGAMVGAAIGGGIGPIVGAVGSSGALNFIGTTFSTAGAFAKIGMLTGGLAGASGAWSVGQSLGGLAGKVPGAVVGAGVGAVKGAWNYMEGATGAATPEVKPDEPSKPKKQDLNEFSGVGKFAASVVAGTGLLAGVTGGATLGAGVMSAGSLTAGLLAKDLTWSALTGAAQAGAIGGAIAFGIIGAVGGWNLVKAGESFIKGSINKVHQGQQWLELDKRENLLKAEEGKLNELEASTAKANAQAQADVKKRTQELDGRDGAIKEGEADYAHKTSHKDELITERGDELYRGEKTRLVKTEGELNARKVTLDGEESRINQKEKDVPVLTEQRAKRLLADLENKLEANYQGRKGKLDDRERDVNRREANIPNVVEQNVAAELNPIKNNIASTKRETDQIEDRTDQTRRNTSSTLGQVPMVQGQAQSERSRADRLDREADNLQPSKDRLLSDVNQSRSQLEQKHNDNNRLRDDLRECQNGKK